MKYADNIRAVAALLPDYMGFIFYDKSKRYVGEELDENQLHQLPTSIKKIGVFVNSVEKYILEKVNRYGLYGVQLHGEESPELCAALKEKNILVIKVFLVDEHFNFATLQAYSHCTDYILFDTKSEQYGGTGTAFDWELLNQYDSEKPFFISGGIDLESIDKIKKITHLPIHAIDVNSKFEVSPGMKDIEKLKALKIKIST
jgi:phosphoribosylanthranilate isomerase